MAVLSCWWGLPGDAVHASRNRHEVIVRIRQAERIDIGLCEFPFIQTKSASKGELGWAMFAIGRERLIRGFAGEDGAQASFS